MCKNILTIFYRALCKLHLSKQSVIIMVDGGICSQMHQYMIGQIISSAGQCVEYDLSFYDKGLDLNGQPTRLFLLDTLFPYVQCKRAKRIKSILYKVCFCNYGEHPHKKDTSWKKAKAPLYLAGYYTDINEMYMDGGYFSSLFIIDTKILTSSKQVILKQIKQTQSVGVHIRRGDLKEFNVAYGHPVTINYIKDAINYYLSQSGNPTFYFFTDDIEYVNKELIPSLGINIHYWVSDTDFGKVYEDLVLLATCKNIITSKGTMGKYAALFKNAQTTVIAKDDSQRCILEDGGCKYVVL